jgi:hypothetical protein
MAAEMTLEERVAALEEAVAALQQRLAGGPVAPDWLDKVVGSVTDDEVFAEILEYGRAFREADRPPDDAGEGS